MRLFGQFQRNCPKRGTSNAPIVNLAGIRRANCTEKPLFGGLQCFAASASEAFRTVSPRRWVNKPRMRQYYRW
jgi:hypothetical protein